MLLGQGDGEEREQVPGEAGDGIEDAHAPSYHTDGLFEWITIAWVAQALIFAIEADGAAVFDVADVTIVTLSRHHVYRSGGILCLARITLTTIKAYFELG